MGFNAGFNPFKKKAARAEQELPLPAKRETFTEFKQKTGLTLDLVENDDGSSSLSLYHFPDDLLGQETEDGAKLRVDVATLEFEPAELEGAKALYAQSTEMLAARAGQTDDRDTIREELEALLGV